MKAAAYVLVMLCLALASIAAVTAYEPRLSVVDPAARLTLNAPAGVDPANPQQPLYDPASSAEPVVLTAEVLGSLRAAGVERVRVREFTFGRWDHKMLFFFSMAGLLLGGLVIRRIDRRQTATRLGAAPVEEERPDYALRQSIEAIRRLTSDLQAMPDPARRLAAITERVSHLQDTHLAAFVDARPLLVGQLGMAGYAQLMDRFSSAERLLNRAWSAAADRVLPESISCLEKATLRLEDALAFLSDQAG